MVVTLTPILESQKKIARRIHCTFTVVLFDVCQPTHCTAKSKLEVQKCKKIMTIEGQMAKRLSSTMKFR